MPLPMVLATAVPRRKAATKLKKAAQITASLGDKTRVETTVAMLLAASWKPFKKSKARATATVMISSSNPVFTGGVPLLGLCRNRRPSGALQGHCFQHIGGVFHIVCRRFKHFVQLLHLDELDRVFLLIEQLSNRIAAYAIGFVFQAVDLNAMLQYALILLAERHSLGQLLCLLHD